MVKELEMWRKMEPRKGRRDVDGVQCFKLRVGDPSEERHLSRDLSEAWKLWGANIPGRGSRICQGPEAGAS